MKTITLVRPLRMQSDYATFGVFIDEYRPFAVCLEPPKGSCIKPGTYLCTKYFSPKAKKNVYLLNNVPGFEYIEIHTGVFPRDTKGCLVIGESFENMTYNGFTGDGLAYSSKALFELMARVKNDKFYLEIVEVD